MQQLEITVTAQGGCRVVQIAGEIDLATAPQLDAAVNRGGAPGIPLVLDLAAVRFLDASGLRSLLIATRAAHYSAPLRIVTSPAVGRVVNLAGAQQILALFPDRRLALAFRARPAAISNLMPDHAVVGGAASTGTGS